MLVDQNGQDSALLQDIDGRPHGPRFFNIGQVRGLAYFPDIAVKVRIFQRTAHGVHPLCPAS